MAEDVTKERETLIHLKDRIKMERVLMYMLEKISHPELEVIKIN